MTSINILLADLDTDTLFVEQARRLGLVTLGDILEARVEVLSKKKDFSYTWYADLLTLLKKHGLLGEFQNRQL
ncbi:MAG: hypothetical protein ACTJHT_10165 [Sphingobacterium sp.]|uniref:hypothetical protein n=1 Tax=Sphingobacterium sp. JB170 TaxID=1434842 RepID=UPI00097E773A|nr:hypothetical protein [Sphingobacterium sp. JB170]SJN36752.1 hypothetical protein FM107_09015 [Sphingobacterium sp. JB170]